MSGDIGYPTSLCLTFQLTQIFTCDQAKILTSFTGGNTCRPSTNCKRVFFTRFFYAQVYIDERNSVGVITSRESTTRGCFHFSAGQHFSNDVVSMVV